MKTIRPQELLFIINWLLPTNEANRRIGIIDEYINNLESKNDLLKEYFNHKATLNQKKIAYTMAWLKPITDDMLLNYLLGIGKLFLVLRYNRYQDEQEYDILVEPAVSLFSRFIKSEVWQKYLIEKGVDQNAVFLAETICVPISAENLYNYAGRIKETLLTIMDVDKLKKRYNQYLYETYYVEPRTAIEQDPQNSNLEKNTKHHLKVFDKNKLDKLNDIYLFCIDEKIFTEVELHEFHECISKIDFSKLFMEKVLLRSKFKYIIFRLNLIINDSLWYKNAAKSIEVEPNKCSGANVPDEWKEMIDDLLNARNKKK